MLQRDLLRGNSVYMVGSCRARLLHIIHVSAVSEVGVLQAKCSRQPAPRGNYKFKLKMPPGLAAVARLLRAACRRVNAPVVFLCFYFAARLSRRSRAACRVPCKRSLTSVHLSVRLSLCLSVDKVSWTFWQKTTIGSINFKPGFYPYEVTLLTPIHLGFPSVNFGPMVSKYLAEN